MRFTRPVRLTAIALLLGIGGAIADPAWQSVSLNAPHDLVIDVPSSAGEQYLPNAQARAGGALLNVDTTGKTGGRLYCTLLRAPYDDPARLDELARNFDSTKGKDLCAPEEGARNAKILDYEALKINGQPAGRCTMSVTDPSSANAGMVVSQLNVAGPGALYLLECAVNDSTQAAVEADWDRERGAQVRHMQESLHLPKVEN